MNLNNGFIKRKKRSSNPYNKKTDAPDGYLSIRVYRTKYKMSVAMVRIRIRQGRVEYIQPSYKIFIKDQPPTEKL